MLISKLLAMCSVFVLILAMPVLNSTDGEITTTINTISTQKNEQFLHKAAVVYEGNVIDFTKNVRQVISKNNYTALIEKYSRKLISLFAMSTKGNIYILNSSEDLKKKEHSNYMSSKDNQIYFQQTKSMVFFNRTDNHWNEYFAPREVEINRYNLIPVGNCLTCTTKGGCNLSQKYTRGLTIVDSFNANIERTSWIILTGTFGFAYSFTSAQSFTYSDTYQCNLANGQVGQIYIEPKYVEMGESYVKRVKFNKLKGLIYKHKYGKRYQKMRLLLNERPTHHCIVRDIDCGLDCNEPKVFNNDIVIKFQSPIDGSKS